MPLTNYSELKASIADWLNRDDLVAVIPSFISLAEADISRKLRDYRMETRTTLTVSGQYTALPANWLETVRLQVTGGTSQLELASQGALAEMRASINDQTGRPTHYALTGGQLELFPTPDQSYDLDLVYVAKVTALSDSATSNWLLVSAPDAYLYGALTQSAPYLKDDARTAIWAGLYSEAISALNTASERSRYSGAMLRLRRRGL